MAHKASVGRRRSAHATAWAFFVLLLAIPSIALANTDLGLRLSLSGRDGAQPSTIDMAPALSMLVLGLVILTATTLIMHIIQRRTWVQRQTQLEKELGTQQGRLHQAELFMSADRQVVVAWRTAGSEPDIEGDVSMLVEAGAPRRVLGFNQWLPAGDAARLEAAVEKLKTRGEGFNLSADTAGERRMEIMGRAVTGRAVMRIREVTGDRLERLKTEESYRRLTGEMAALQALLDSVPQPIWLRYPDGQLAWVNKAYTEAVDCRFPNEVISKGLELIDRPQREKIAASGSEGVFRGRLTAILSGKRHLMDITDTKTDFGSGGIATDASEIDTLQNEFKAETATHTRTLNELPTPVAIFDNAKHLRFHNAAYMALWGLDAAFLATHPSDAEILDRLRADRKLPEQVDFRLWKQALLDGYQKQDSIEHHWHLPDGKMLRVSASPTPQGGMNYVYEDMTERVTLEMQFKALTRVQSETLDSLKEAVAVFGSDGRLKLANAAFSVMWQLHAEALQGNPHIDELIKRAPLAVGNLIWTELRGDITGMADERRALTLRDVRADHMVIDCRTAPLPDGATLVSFADVTASVNAELFLKERNDALEDSARMKSAFIKTVSFELREPLQGVTMAVGLLADETIGPLSPKQKEYAQDAKREADALLSLMNDIFDLNSVDAGMMELDITEVTPAEEMDAVATVLVDKLKKSQVALTRETTPDIGTLKADGLRIRQVLFNLLSNAIAFSAPGQTVRMSARRTDNSMVFEVADDGCGIPEDVQSRIFQPFERHGEVSGQRGVGLGLSMVKAFVELHGGEVTMKTAQGQGTIVTCTFPLDPATAPDRANAKQTKAA
jgi:signal transduction histidine kinase